jgi:hypothetical protein
LPSADRVSREELTATLAARQLLIERVRITPAEAIRHLTPLQGQDPRAPFIALAARLEGFTRGALEAAIDARQVVKTTIMRLTLHLAAAEDYLAFHQLARQARMRSLHKQYPHLDLDEVAAELREWMAVPRTNVEIREKVGAIEGVPVDQWSSVLLLRTLLPLVQLPPAGHWDDPRRASFVADPRPEPSPTDAAEIVVRRYLAAFGPASRRDIASWSGAAQRDFADALERIGAVSCRDEKGTELLDLPGLRLAPASTELPVRLVGNWDQSLLAFADRERVMTPVVQALKLTLSGDRTVLVGGRVAASWTLSREDSLARVEVTPHVELRRADKAAIRAEAKRAARVCEPEARRVEVVGV